MFSELEEQRALFDQIDLPEIGNSTSTPDTLQHVKQTLQRLLRSAAGATPPKKAFMLCDKSRRGVSYLFIVIACIRLDVGSHTAVVDAFVAMGVPAVRAALETMRRGYASTSRPGPRKADDDGIQRIDTDADETAAWFHLLPRLTERCRTWPHKPSCAYSTSENQEQKPGEQIPRTRGRQNPLCLCGVGIGTEVLPKAFERVAPYLTRAAFSPLFSVPYLEEMPDDPEGDPFMDMDMGWPSSWEDATRGMPPHPWNADIGKMDAVGKGYRCRACGKEGSMACSRCKRVRYCSKECQRADWRDHKKACNAP